MNRAAVRLAPSLLLAACGSLPAPDAEDSLLEWDRELPDGVRIADLGDDEPRTHLPVRVVEDATGNPIPGARIDGWDEAGTPGAWSWADYLYFSERTDRDGLALIPVEHPPDWHYVEAPGFGPWGEQVLEEEIRLKPGVDVVVEVRDLLDRPLPGVEVECMLRSRHTPPVRVVTTGPDGRCTFRCVDPERGFLWVRGAGIAGRNGAYDNGFDGLEWAGDRWILRGDPAPVVEGRVLLFDGTPAAGAAVGTAEAHRGPWTLTDGDGRFRLLGAPPWTSLDVRYRPDGDDGTLFTTFRPVPGFATTVRLPDPADLYENGEMRPRPEGEAPLLLRVRVVTPEHLAPPSEVRITLVREEDGLSWWDVIPFVDGVAEGSFEVEPGRWRAAVVGGAGPLRPVEAFVEVGEEGGEVVLRPEAAPRWSFRVFRREPGSKEPVEIPRPWPGTLTLVWTAGRDRAVPAPGLFGEYYFRSGEPFLMEYREEGWVGRMAIDSLTVRGPGGSMIQFHVVAEPEPPGPPMELASPPRAGDIPGARWPAAEVEIRAVDEAGAPLAEFAVVQESRKSLRAKDGVVRLRGAAAGPLRFWIQAPGRRARDVRLVLAEGDRRQVTAMLNPTHIGGENGE